MRYPFKYRVITDVSSIQDSRLTPDGRELLFETNNFQVARKECIEWAAYDDILVEVFGPYGYLIFSCDGNSEAITRYPRTAEKV